MKSQTIACAALVIGCFTTTSVAADEIAKIPAGKAISVCEKGYTKTDNNGAKNRILLGTNADTFFCSLSQASFYRHGDPNRGLLSCRVYAEGANWYLEADGPSHNQGTARGAAQTECAAMCISLSCN